MSMTIIIHAAMTTTSNDNNNNNKEHKDVVIAMGISNDLFTYKQFIGSLRHSGYQGRIILGRPLMNHNDNNENNNKIHQDDIIENNNRIDTFLQKHQVTIKYLQYSDSQCQHSNHKKDENNNNSNNNNSNSNMNDSCVLLPYTHLKMGWSGYALARDWLYDECQNNNHYNNHYQQQNDQRHTSKNVSCHDGNVLLIPLHNVYFQRNPFTIYKNHNHNNNIQKPFLHLFEESYPYKTINTNHALTQCKKFLWNVPHLSTIVYTDFTSMMFYLHSILHELSSSSSSTTSWMNHSQCYSLSNNGVAIHNYLFYNGQIQSNGVFENQMNIVNSVAMIANHYHNDMKYIETKQGDDQDWSTTIMTKLQKDHYMDDDGYFLNLDGSRSAIVHHFEGFGLSFRLWLLLKQKLEFKVNDDSRKNENNDNHHHRQNEEDETDQWGKDVILNYLTARFDNPMNNPFYYLSLESPSVYTKLQKSFLQKRKFVTKIEHDE